jgi:uncharacterized membrane protein
MSPRVRALVVVLAVAAATHVALLVALPRAIMALVTWKGGERLGTNRFAHLRPPDADAREIVRPCPDFAYSACFVDLARGPVELAVPLTPPYTSVALYSSTTDNVFARSDRDTAGAPLHVVVVPSGAPRPATIPEGATLVEVPGDRVFALVRRVVERPGDLARIDEVRGASVCAPVR